MTILNLSPFQLQTIVERHWAGESLPRLADEYNINRVELFNYKNENRRLWAEIEQNSTRSEIRNLLNRDARANLSDRDTARVSLCMFLLKHIPQRGTRPLPYRNFIVETVLRFNHDDPEKQVTFEHAEIHNIDDAKAAVKTFEQHVGVSLLETPAHPHSLERTPYHD